MRTHTLVRDPDYVDIHGVLISRLPHWYFVREIEDFHFNGYSLVARDTVSRVRYNRFDKILNEMFIRYGESAMEQPPISTDGPDLSDQFIFQQLAALETILQVEDEDEEKFMMGTILRFTKDRLFMRYFETNGHWMKRPVGIDFAEISYVAFLGEYELTWEKYLRDQKNFEPGMGKSG